MLHFRNDDCLVFFILFNFFFFLLLFGCCCCCFSCSLILFFVSIKYILLWVRLFFYAYKTKLEKTKCLVRKPFDHRLFDTASNGTCQCVCCVCILFFLSHFLTKIPNQRQKLNRRSEKTKPSFNRKKAFSYFFRGRRRSVFHNKFT